MEVEVTSEKQNPMLKRKEISFKVEHGEKGSTPSRAEIRKAVAAAIKSDESIVFIEKFETGTGTQTAHGTANIYDSVEQAKLIEPEYVIKRNIPSEKGKQKEGTKTKEEKKADEKKE
jgi:small subunit ribosomal protein S24e